MRNNYNYFGGFACVCDFFSFPLHTISDMNKNQKNQLKYKENV